jgi:hypothetical protein
VAVVGHGPLDMQCQGGADGLVEAQEVVPDASFAAEAAVAAVDAAGADDGAIDGIERAPNDNVQ